MAEEIDVEAILDAAYNNSQHKYTDNKMDVDKDENDDKYGDRSSSSSRTHRSRSKVRGDNNQCSRKSYRSRSRHYRSDRSDSEKRTTYRNRSSQSIRDQYEYDPPERPRTFRGRRYRNRSRDSDADHRQYHKRAVSPRLKHANKRMRSPSLDEKSPPRKRQRRGSSVFSDLNHMCSEERDERTVLCMQLPQRTRASDLKEFFSSVGKVRDVRLVMCYKTKKFKGIAYIEFKEKESVPLALGLSGQSLLGVSIRVQHSQAEKNRTGSIMSNMTSKGPVRLYVGSLHYNVSKDMLMNMFAPYGQIDNIQMFVNLETGMSKGYSFITFRNAADARNAVNQLNNFELAGRPMKVSTLTYRSDIPQTQGLDTDDLDRSGIDLGVSGRLRLMTKLAENAGFEIPAATVNALVNSNAVAVVPQFESQCFVLNGMFDPSVTDFSNPNWQIEIENEVIQECNKHGGILHISVDKTSPNGNVYVKCPTIAISVNSVKALHGRWYNQRNITANYILLINYHAMFPDAINATRLLGPTKKIN